VTGEALRPGDPPYLGGYRIERRLGEGGQGLVYLGVSPSGEKVAIKVLRSRPLAGDASAISREIAAARQVAEFCTASILDVALDHDPPYIVSEYVDGPTLQQVIKTEGVRTGAALHRLAVATITALAAIHRAGVVHRDFKPGNVLLAPDGPRVIDFGIARILDATTTTGATTGSPPYMAPEHFTGARVGPEADVFAWGSTMVFAATGRPPFGGESFAAVAYRILHAEPELSALPEPLREVVRQCLAKDPARRPTAHEVLLRLLNRGDPAADDALEQGRAVARGVAPPSSGDDPPTEPATPRRKVLAGAGTVAAALAASGAMLGYRLLVGGATERTAGEPSPGAAATSARRPTASAAPPLPERPQELVAAIDAALVTVPSADFSFTGFITQSSWSVSAKGRLFHDSEESRETAYDMLVTYPDEDENERHISPERLIIVAGIGYAVQRRNAKFETWPSFKRSPGYAAAAQMVYAMSSPETVMELVTGTPRLQRRGRTYTGGVTLEQAGRNIQLYVRDWSGQGEQGEEDVGNVGHFTYSLTVDERILPTRLRLGWRMPYGDGSILESQFTTTYTRWRNDQKINPPH